MKIIEAMKSAGEYGNVSRKVFPIYPFGIPVEFDDNNELSITCDLSISDIEADDWEVVDYHG
jgi:hypothetical protein